MYFNSFTQRRSCWRRDCISSEYFIGNQFGIWMRPSKLRSPFCKNAGSRFQNYNTWRLKRWQDQSDP